MWTKQHTLERWTGLSSEVFLLSWKQRKKENEASGPKKGYPWQHFFRQSLVNTTA